MNPIVIIPARLGSTRLPAKPLADIGGVPMVVRVWREAVRANIGPVYVAAAEKKIADVVTKAGGKAVLTDPSLPSGTDRIHAALKQIDPEESFDAVVNLQAEFPLLEAAILRPVIDALSFAGSDVATLVVEIDSKEDIENRNIVKVVVAWSEGGQNGRALYFSREPIPHGAGPYFHHIGIYAYTRPALSHFVSLPPSVLEKREKLEQLRALEAGMTISVARIAEAPVSVDTPEDLEKARAMLK